MAHRLIVAGIGPGSREYILPKALNAIEDAKYLAGGRRALADFAHDGQETYPVTGKLSLLAEWIGKSLLLGDVVVMVSGDPGFYSLLPWLKVKFPAAEIEVIPGISSVQAAFCRIGEYWQGAEWLSFHGRVPPEEKLLYAPGKRLAFLTDHEHNPAFIAGELMKRGWPGETRAAAAEHISYETEQVKEGTLADLAGLPGFGESVMVVMG